RGVVVIAVTSLLAGCATLYGATIPSPEELRSATAWFVGQPVQSLLPRYGYPHEQTEFYGDRVLLWHTSRTLQFRSPTSATTTGAVGDPGFPWAQIPYVQTMRGYNMTSSDYHCTMQVAVYPDGTIKAVGFAGKMG